MSSSPGAGERQGTVDQALHGGRRLTGGGVGAPVVEDDDLPLGREQVQQRRVPVAGNSAQTHVQNQRAGAGAAESGGGRSAHRPATYWVSA